MGRDGMYGLIGWSIDRYDVVMATHSIPPPSRKEQKKECNSTGTKRLYLAGSLAWASNEEVLSKHGASDLTLLHAWHAGRQLADEKTPRGKKEKEKEEKKKEGKN
jgi:hypothetical protein